jgi:hypothetical protein
VTQPRDFDALDCVGRQLRLLDWMTSGRRGALTGLVAPIGSLETCCSGSARPAARPRASGGNGIATSAVTAGQDDRADRRLPWQGQSQLCSVVFS